MKGLRLPAILAALTLSLSSPASAVSNVVAFPTVSAVNSIGSASSSYPNITIATVSLSGVTGTGIYTWLSAGCGAIDGVTWIRPTATPALTGCYKLVGFAAPVAFDINNLALLNVANTWVAAQTFTNSDILLLGSSTGKTTFTSDNAGATNYTLHFPAIDGTLATTANLGAYLPLAGGTLTGPTTISGTSFGFSGNITGSGIFGTSGIRLKNVSGTFSDTTSSGTIALDYVNVFGGNTLTATSPTTITNHYNTYFTASTCSTNVTCTHAYALGADSLNLGGVLNFSSDTGITRESAGVVDVGNGAAGNTSGTVKATTFVGALTGTASGNLTSAANSIALGNIAQSGANTMLGNWTGSTANVAANAMPSCADTTGNHLNYVNGTGVTCGTSVPVAPIFSAHSAVPQNVTTNTLTQVTLGTEVYDTNSNFSASRFTPTVAGYYQLNATLYCSGTVVSNCAIDFQKNGASWRYGSTSIVGATASDTIVSASTIVFLNGSTDYVELWGVSTATGVAKFNYSSADFSSSFDGHFIHS